MRPRKKGQQYEICYRCPGYSKPIYERFPTYEAANLRVAQIEYEKSIGEFRPPKQTPIQTKRLYKPNERRKSLSRSVSFWMNTCRSMG